MFIHVLSNFWERQPTFVLSIWSRTIFDTHFPVSPAKRGENGSWKDIFLGLHSHQAMFHTFKSLFSEFLYGKQRFNFKLARAAKHWGPHGYQPKWRANCQFQQIARWGSLLENSNIWIASKWVVVTSEKIPLTQCKSISVHPFNATYYSTNARRAIRTEEWDDWEEKQKHCLWNKKYLWLYRNSRVKGKG